MINEIIEYYQNLSEYTDEELKAELKRRIESRKAEKAAIPRCRNCKYYATVSYWGHPAVRTDYHNRSACCPFLKTKNNKYHRFVQASDKACEHYEKLE